MTRNNQGAAAIIIAYNSAAVLPACLACVNAAELPAIVVDNASADDSADIARASGARVIVNILNQGFGRAMNQGLAAAETDLCLLLNPDIEFAADAPHRLAQVLAGAPNAMIAAPRLLEPDGRAFELAASPINPAVAPRAISGGVSHSVLSGAALLARREAVLRLGGFDPNIFLFWEDNDLCRRIVDSSGELLLADDVPMNHRRGGSSAPTPGSIYKVRWHQAWSRFYVFAKYGVPANAEKWLGRFSRKAALARMFGAKERLERYQGSLDGARAFLRGHSALAHEGLA